MRNLSKKAQQAMESRRGFYASAEITFADGTEKTLGRSDFTLSGNTVIDSAESNSFPLGILASKRVTLSLMNDDDRWSEYDFYGAKIFLQTKFDLDGGTTETLNIGTFTVVTPESYGTVISVTAMDDSYKTDKDYSTSLSFPVTLGVALSDSCRSCGITQIGDVPNSDYLIPSAPENVTHRQFIGLCAMIAGGNAKFDEYNRLKIVPYDFTNLERFEGWDGGTFAPWTKGDVRDGGTFNPWSDGDSADGGQFGDRDNVHVLYEFASGMTIDVDDVVITGVQMDGKDADSNTVTHLFGEEGYVLSLDNRIAVGKEDEALKLIGAKIVGLRFRPFSGDHISLPTAEFMDLAMIVDWKQNVYQTVLTDVAFNYFGFTGLKCAADSPIRNSSKYYGREAKAIIEARQMVQKEKTERDLAVGQLANELAHSSGLYIKPEVQPDGSTIYYMHDKPTLEESMIVWKITAEAIGISTDGGKTYPVGVDATGVAILDRIYAIGLNADYIKTGAFEIVKDGKVMVLMDKDTGEVILRPDTFELSDGSTIGSIAEDKAQNAVDGQTQEDIFNRLTKNGTLKGLYMSGGELYMNASYIKTGIFKVAKGAQTTFSANADTGEVNIVATSFSLVSGDTIDSIAQSKATAAQNNAKNYTDSKAGSTLSDAKNYSDTTAASKAKDAVNDAMTQQNIFDKLTNGGKTQGIYLRDGKVYINADYVQTGTFSAARIKGGTLTLGGSSNTNGSLKILNSSGAEVGHWDNTGFKAITGTIGPWVINSAAIYNGIDYHGQKNSNSTGIGPYGTSWAFWAGDGRFSVKQDGTLYAENGTFAGSLSGATGTFSGSLSAASGTFNGVIKNVSGSFATEIDDGNLYSYYGSSVKCTYGIVESSGFYKEGVPFENTSSVISAGTPMIRVNSGNLLYIILGSSVYMEFASGYNINVSANMRIAGSLTLKGSKSRIASTENYQEKLLYCYEMPSPMFGDIGEAVTDENGECYIFLDDIFSETVSAQIEYQVFLQKEGPGDIWISEKTPQYFVVKGTENLKFAWEIKAKQKGYEYERLETYTNDETEEIDYEQQYFEELELLIREQEEMYS